MTFRDALRRLFSRNIIITRVPGDRLKVFDVNKTQSSTGASNPFNYRNKWRNGRNFSTLSGYGSGFTNFEVEAMRKQMYIDYELMDTDAIIASALDVYSDESCTASVEGQLLVIKTEDDTLRKILHNLFYDVLNIEFNLWSWVRSACKYGDYFLYLQIVEKHGVVNVIPIHPSLLVREDGSDDDPNKVVFRYEGDGGFIGTNTLFEQFEIAHFRLITDSNFLPYGRAIIEPARKEYKKLCLPGYSRIWTNTGYREIQHINVGDIVYSVNLTSNIPVETIVKNKILSGNKDVYKIRLTNRIFYGSAEHLYLTRDKVYKKISELSTDDYIIISDIVDQKSKTNIPSLKLDCDVYANFNDDFFVENIKNKFDTKCLICNCEFKRLNELHLKHKHGTTFADYSRKYIGNISYYKLKGQNHKIKYNDAILFCETFGVDVTKLKKYIKSGKVEIINEQLLIDNFKMFVRFFGFMLGDGWIDKNSVVFSMGDRLDKSNKYLDFLDTIKTKYTVIHEGQSKAYCQINNKYFTLLLKQLGFITGTSNKIVPTWIYSLNAEYILEFLLGFADADGCDVSHKKDNTRFVVSGINKKMLTDMNVLAQQIGLECSSLMSTRHNSIGKRWGNSEKIYKVNDCYSFTFNLKTTHKTNIADNIKYQKILSIENIGNDDVYDIEVDNVNHNFIVDGVIAHNCLVEDSMMLNRIMRAPERRLFKIDVGNIAPEEVDAYIEQITSEMKKIPYIDPQTGDYNLRYNVENSLEDYFLPVRGGESGTTIETLAGLSNEGQIQDVEYVKDKMLAALKIPKSFIGFGEGGDGKANLSSIDVRFARTIERVQKIIVSELYKIAFVHLHSQGLKSDDLLNFELELTSPSIIYERQKIDLLNEKINLIANIKEHNLFSNKYIYEVIFGLSETEWTAEQDRIVEDLKQAFRLEQIKSEGNDPKTSGRTFGTPHDIASMQVASKFDVFNAEDTKRLYSPDEREFNEGQPEKFGSFETKRDPNMGRDPVGKKQLDAQIKAPMESFSKLKIGLDKFLDKKRQILSEAMLDEDNILNGEV